VEQTEQINLLVTVSQFSNPGPYLLSAKSDSPVSIPIFCWYPFRQAFAPVLPTPTVLLSAIANQWRLFFDVLKSSNNERRDSSRSDYYMSAYSRVLRDKAVLLTGASRWSGPFAALGGSVWRRYTSIVGPSQGCARRVTCECQRHLPT
jgi:hypothetical protein